MSWKTDLPEQEIINKYNQGMTGPEIANYYNCSNMPIYRIFREHGIMRKNISPIRQKRYSEICEKYKNGKSQQELAVEYNYTQPAIGKILKRYNVPAHSIHYRGTPTGHGAYFPDFVANETENTLRTQLGKDLYLKLKCLEHYGNKCAKCFTMGHEFLTVDHINEIGYHGRRKQLQGMKIWRYLLKNNFPEGFQILCWNCNWVKWLDKNSANNKPYELFDNRYNKIRYQSRSYYRERHLNQRKEGLMLLGPLICVCCGYNEDWRVLTVDHKDGNKMNNDLNNLQILCINCNAAKRKKRYCPHYEYGVPLCVSR